MRVIREAQTDPERLDRHRRRADSYGSITLDDIKTLAAEIFVPSRSVTYHVIPET